MGAPPAILSEISLAVRVIGMEGEIYGCPASPSAMGSEVSVI